MAEHLLLQNKADSFLQDIGFGLLFFFFFNEYPLFTEKNEVLELKVAKIWYLPK